MSVPRLFFPPERLVPMLCVADLNLLAEWADIGGCCILISEHLTPKVGSKPIVTHRLVSDPLEIDPKTLVDVMAILGLATDEAENIADMVFDTAEVLGLPVRNLHVWNLGKPPAVRVAVRVELDRRRKDNCGATGPDIPGFGYSHSIREGEVKPGEFGALGKLLFRWGPNVWAWSDHTLAEGVSDLMAEDAFPYSARIYGHQNVFYEIPVADVLHHPILNWVSKGNYPCVGLPLQVGELSDDGTMSLFLVPEAQWRAWVDKRIIGPQWQSVLNPIIERKALSLHDIN